MASLTNLMLENSQRFNGSNYNTWKQRMLTIFEYRRLDALVLGTETRPVPTSTPGGTFITTDQDKFDDRNREAVMLLKLSVTDDQLPQIPSGKSAADIWKYLKELHETSDKSRAFFLKNQLFSIMMDERMSLQEHLTKIKDIRDQLDAIGRQMEEEDMVVITLKSLPTAYEHFIETLNITSTNVDLKFPELCTKLLQQDRWKQQFGNRTSSSSSEQAFAAKFQSSQSSQQGSSHQFSGSYQQKSVQCHYCHKYGHMKKDCRQRLASEQKKLGRSNPQANVAEYSDHSEQKESVFYAFMAKSPSDLARSSAWYIDSGASRHFSHRRDWFTDFYPYSDSVVFGGGEEFKIVGKGNVQIQSGGCQLIFLNVCYVPGMALNLLSVSQIMRNSPQLDVVFSSLKCSIIDRETRLTVATGLEDHGLYRLTDTGDSPEIAMAARDLSLSTLWHQRYGHLNIQYLSQLSREELVSGLPPIQMQHLGVCDACQAGKQHRTPFKDGDSWRASQDADSDLDFEIEPSLPVGAEALAEASACVKVLEASGIPKSSGQPSHSVVEAPLTINIPSSTSVADVHTNNQQSVISTQGMNITVPVSIQKQPFPAVSSSDGIDGNVSMSSVHPPRRKRKLWTAEEDQELIAAVQKCGEGNWSSILKGAFKHDRTASQLSQRWSLIRKRNVASSQSNLGNSSTLSGPVDLPHSTAQVVPVTGSISSGASITVTVGPTIAVTGSTTGTTAVTIPSSSLTLPTASTGSGSSLFHSTARAASDNTTLQLSQGHQGLEQGPLHGIAGSSSLCATLPSVKSRPKSKKNAANKSSTGRMISPMPPPATTAAMSSVSTPAKTAVSIPAASPGSGRYGINPATQSGISEALGHGSSMPLSGPHPLVQAAAVAAGARIAPPSAAASLLKAAQSGNVVHFGVGGVQLAKSGYATQAGTACGTTDNIRSSNVCISSSARASGTAGSNMRASNVHYIRTGSVSSPPVYTGVMPSVQRLPASQPKGHTVKAVTTGPSIPQSSRVNLLTGTTLPSKQASENCGASQAQSSGTSPSNVSVLTSKGNLKSQIVPSITEASQTFQSDLHLKPSVSDTILSVPPILTSTANQMSTEQAASVLQPAGEICSGASSSLSTSNSPCLEIDPCQFTNAPAEISSVPTISEDIIVNNVVTIQEDKIIELKNNYSLSATSGSSQHQVCSERHTPGETAASSERHMPGETAGSSECADVRTTIEVQNENESEKNVEIKDMPGSPPVSSNQNVSSSAQNDISDDSSVVNGR